MKVLCLVRHAKSSWDNPTLDDTKRLLNKRGERDAPRMANRLKEKNIAFDLILCSPSQRTLQTLLRMNELLKFPTTSIRTEDSLYHASASTVLKIAQQLPDKLDSVMLIGHNPGLTDFVNELMNQSIDNLPTCSVVICTLRIKSWSEIAWGEGELIYYDYPKKEIQK